MYTKQPRTLWVSVSSERKIGWVEVCVFASFFSQAMLQCKTRCRHSSSSTRLTRKWSYYLEHAWIGFAQLNHVDMWKNSKILWPIRLERCASMNTISKYSQHERNIEVSCSSFSNTKRMFYLVWRKFSETDRQTEHPLRKFVFRLNESDFMNQSRLISREFRVLLSTQCWRQSLNVFRLLFFPHDFVASRGRIHGYTSMEYK